MGMKISEGARARHGLLRSPVQPRRRRTDPPCWRQPSMIQGRLWGQWVDIYIASIQRVMENRGSEISEFAQIRELDELTRNFENLRHRENTRNNETSRTQSEQEMNPILMYYGKVRIYLHSLSCSSARQCRRALKRKNDPLNLGRRNGDVLA